MTTSWAWTRGVDPAVAWRVPAQPLAAAEKAMANVRTMRID
jgi:hypothetical protein